MPDAKAAINNVLVQLREVRRLCAADPDEAAQKVALLRCHEAAAALAALPPDALLGPRFTAREAHRMLTKAIRESEQRMMVDAWLTLQDAAADWAAELLAETADA